MLGTVRTRKRVDVRDIDDRISDGARPGDVIGHVFNPSRWLLALVENGFCCLKAVGADRDPAIDRDLDEHRAQFLRCKAVDLGTADMVGELSHLAERGDHTEGENAALARRQCLLAPYLAPAVFGHQPLKIAVEIIDVCQCAVHIGIAQHLPAFGEPAVVENLIHADLSFSRRISRHQALRSPNHFSADRLGMNMYSPPRSTLNDWMPWMRRLTGSFGIVNVASPSCRPTSGSRSSPSPVKFPLLIHSRCRNSIVAIALALMKRKKSPRGTSSSV